jgi:hypothetical protein
LFGRLTIPLVVVFVCNDNGGARDGPVLDAAEFGVPAPRELPDDVGFDVILELCAANPRAMSNAFIGVIDDSVREVTGVGNESTRVVFAGSEVRELDDGLMGR